MSDRILVVDACCLLNLLATGREVDLAAALQAIFLVTPEARDESRYLCGPPDPDDDEQRPTQAPVDLGRLLSAKRLEVRGLGEEAADTFVTCASYLRDADASSLALAVTVGVPLATDDAKVQKVAHKLFPETVVVSTLHLVREAAHRLGLAGEPLRRLAQDLRLRGNFEPPRRDPDRAWFEAALDGAGP